MLAVGANGTAIMAALPTMRTELFLNSAGVQWAVNAYLVVSAACIVLGGQAADRIGARLASMVGLALFGVASCIIATAGTQTELLAGRAMQSLAAAFAVPGTLAAVDTSAGARHDAPWCFFKKLQEMTQGKPTAPAVGDFRAVWKVDTIDIKFGVHPGCACLK